MESAINPIYNVPENKEFNKDSSRYISDVETVRKRIDNAMAVVYEDFKTKVKGEMATLIIKNGEERFRDKDGWRYEGAKKQMWLLSESVKKLHDRDFNGKYYSTLDRYVKGNSPFT